MCRMRTSHYAIYFAEWFAKYGIRPDLPHVHTMKLRVRGVESTRCTWCFKPQ